MILSIVFGAALMGGGLFAYKHYKGAAKIAAAKAEITKIEGEVKAAVVKMEPSAIIARIKAKL